MKDTLQKKLEKMEKKSPSPSLQLLENKKPSLKEKLYFGARALIGGLIIRKSKDSERALQETQRTQEQEEAKTFEGKKPQLMYQTSLFQLQKDQLFGWQFKKDQRNRENERTVNAIQRVRSGLLRDTSGNMIRISPGSLSGQMQEIKKKLQEGSFAPEKTYLSETLDKLGELYKEVDMQFPRNIYESFLEKRGMVGAQKSLDELENYVTSNTCSVSGDGISFFIDRASSWLRMGNKTFKDKAQIIEQMKEKYAQEARTVPISEASKKYDIKIVHGIPYYKNNFGKYPQFANNAHWNEQVLSRNGNPDELELENFFENIFSKRPDISTSAIRKNSEPKEFFSPYGVLIREGKIYEASTTDLASQGELKPHFVRMTNFMCFETSRDISERLKEVATVPPQTHNEVIIGDNYEIGGLYFVENHHGWGHLSRQLEGHPRYQTHESSIYEPAIVARVAQEANKRSVPLYRFRQGEGFVAVKPEEYLMNSVAKPSKTTRKKVK